MKKNVLFLLFLLFLNSTVWAQESELKNYQKEYEQCFISYKVQEQDCSDMENPNCYKILNDAHKNIQNCYKSIAIELLMNFYNLSDQEANDRVNNYYHSVREQYLFSFNDDNCEQKDCGTFKKLSSEYVTSLALSYYVQKIIVYHQ